MPPYSMLPAAGNRRYRGSPHWPEGYVVVGVDYATASVTVSRDANAREIEAGRAQIARGSVAAPPFRDGTFDVVRAR